MRLFPSQGSQQGFTVLVIKEMNIKAVPTKELSDYLVKVVADFHERVWMWTHHQEAVKNVRQSDTILQNSPKGDSQSNGAAENAVRVAEGMIRTWKVFVQDKLEHRN